MSCHVKWKTGCKRPCGCSKQWPVKVNLTMRTFCGLKVACDTSIVEVGTASGVTEPRIRAVEQILRIGWALYVT